MSGTKVRCLGGCAVWAVVQGFPDTFRFFGTVHNKHRQIGNAVPPPLSRALGAELRKTLEAARERAATELMAAQGLAWKP